MDNDSTSSVKEEERTERTSSSKWQFSLRQAVVATTVIAGIMAVVLLNQPRRTSDLAKSFHPTIFFNDIIENEKLSGTAFKVSGSTGRSNTSARYAIQIAFKNLSEADVRSTLMPALMKLFLESIKLEGFSISGQSKGGNCNKEGEWVELSNFSFHYGNRRTRGVARAFVAYSRKGKPVVFVTLDES